MLTQALSHEERAFFNSTETVAAMPASLSGESLSQRAVALMGRLQLSLDPLALPRLFSEAIAEELPHEGWFYRHADEAIELGRGMREGDRLEYQLRMGDEVLGELTLCRRRPFEQAETAALDSLVWCLIYPLRNALQHRKALHSAFLDPLTGARNRRAFDESMAHEVALAERNATPLSLVIIDIDHFKSINDNYGHATGDLALQALVECVNATLRDADLLYRFGGEEFVLLLNNTDQEGAWRLAERLRRNLERREFHWGEQSLKMTASFGVSTHIRGEGSATLFERADSALYRAKENGRNRVEGEYPAPLC